MARGSLVALGFLAVPCRRIAKSLCSGWRPARELRIPERASFVLTPVGVISSERVMSPLGDIPSDDPATSNGVGQLQPHLHGSERLAQALPRKYFRLVFGASADDPGSGK
jgi:hypothetical protein